MDLAFLALTGALFVLTIGLIYGLERLRDRK